MQVIFEDKNKRIDSKRTDIVGFDIYARISSRFLERKYNREFGNRNIRVWNSREIFKRNKERIWRRKQRIKKDDRIEGNWTKLTDHE